MWLVALLGTGEPPPFVAGLGPSLVTRLATVVVLAVEEPSSFVVDLADESPSATRPPAVGPSSFAALQPLPIRVLGP